MATRSNCHSRARADAEQLAERTQNPAESIWEVLFAAPAKEATPPEQPAPSEPAGTQKSAARRRKRVRRIVGAVVGKLAGRNERGQPLVHFPNCRPKQWLPARTMVRWTEGDLGKEVVLMFERGNARKPIIIGFLQPSEPHTDPGTVPVQANVDGERLVLAAEKEIVLQCGKATLTLTRAGKVLLRGTYLVSRSTGVNCIKGGSVQIN